MTALFVCVLRGYFGASQFWPKKKNCSTEEDVFCVLLGTNRNRTKYTLKGPSVGKCEARHALTGLCQYWDILTEKLCRKFPRKWALANQRSEWCFHTWWKKLYDQSESRTAFFFFKGIRIIHFVGTNQIDHFRVTEFQKPSLSKRG